MVLIGENQIHKTASLGDTASSRIVMNFSREYLDKIMDIFPEVDFFSFLSEEHNHLLSNITVKQQNHIQGLLQQLLALQEETSPESDALRKMLLATLLLELKDLCRQQQEQGARMAASATTLWIRSSLYRRALRREADPDRHRQSVLYQPYYLSRLFKKSINLSLIEYINGVRIKAAQNLIEKSNESISDIAEKTGFMTTAHFRRVFKDATGLSPQQYRQYYKRVNK